MDSAQKDVRKWPIIQEISSKLNSHIEDPMQQFIRSIHFNPYIQERNKEEKKKRKKDKSGPDRKNFENVDI